MTLNPEEIEVSPLSIEALSDVLDPADWQDFERTMGEAKALLGERELWNVNSTASGGGVAELLRSWVGYARGVGIDMRWLVVAGPPEFFVVTKRLHNFMHGAPGDGGELGKRESEIYELATLANAEELIPRLREQDVVMLHDPQTAGLIPRVREAGAKVIWRCHVGADTVNPQVQAAWDFLRPYVTQADACVFSREGYVPPWSAGVPIAIVPPSIDVLAPKNQAMEPAAVRAILGHVGLVVDHEERDTIPSFTHHDGTPGRVNHMCEVLSTGPPPNPDNPLVVQVSRWDRLKDPIGVMHGFAERTINGTEAHLVLAGPTVHSVADDPEGAAVLDEAEVAWRDLSHAQRSRVHLACIPMLEVEENAAIVNALQRHAAVVVQKSIEEGFGLTVAEAMWKSRPVVASAVGGIRDQIEDGVSGILLEDPLDLETFGDRTLELLMDPDRARKMGENAHEMVKDRFLENHAATQYVKLFRLLLE